MLTTVETSSSMSDSLDHNLITQLDDLENRNRCNNICLRGIPSRCELLIWFRPLQNCLTCYWETLSLLTEHSDPRVVTQSDLVMLYAECTCTPWRMKYCANHDYLLILLWRVPKSRSFRTCRVLSGCYQASPGLASDMQNSIPVGLSLRHSCPPSK